ncbi:MAG: metalloregulator ArsR/SmtB family transcription factor [Paludisphaera borealis]|uniref:ArsR/SmtB family transcription factor n=1 Tax=Paludisphaera borealis TaxID=1387353 RepID=UPI00283ACA63|nr:metalloregulator ArsR/SmtB family transcription factor [Paludisphaera borealis]MDR3618615.1 metalloregulator ArsR/SmtB family transcription factor [Paludisphaera borealis]
MAVAKASPKSTAAPKAATTTVVVAPKAAATRTTKSAKAADQRFQQAKRASILLKHVSDPTRLQVILILAEGERHVGALCAQLSQSQPAVSHHLALLRHGNIIAPRRQGKINFYSLTDTGAELARVVKNLIA